MKSTNPQVILLISPYSSGSTIIQFLLNKSNMLNVIARPNIPIKQAELGFINWAARFWQIPKKSVAYDTVRTMDPRSAVFNESWVKTYRLFLDESSSDGSETIESHFISNHFKPLLPKLDTSSYDTFSKEQRYELIKKGWIELILNHQPLAFGKQPKILHDAQCMMCNAWCAMCDA